MFGGVSGDLLGRYDQALSRCAHCDKLIPEAGRDLKLRPRMTPRHFFPSLLFGLAAGFLVAVAPSCGSTTSSTGPAVCSPSTCNGCCSGNKCINTPTNAQVTTCGQGGVECSNCGTRPCVGFTCGGSDGGSNVCGPGNCGGCCSGTSSASVCINAGSATNCGVDGNVCRSCVAGQACNGGVCASVDGGAGQVGTSCASDDQCAQLGANHVCKKKFSNGNTEYQDGYCTKLCVTDAECPAAALCIGPQGGYGENDSVCWARCNGAEECRDGYDCYTVSATEAACWVKPLPAFDAGPPSDKVGQPCNLDSTCQNPPDDGICFSGTLPDAGPSAFTGGYCSAPCDDSSHCSADGGAVCIAVGTLGACAQTCDGPLQGKSSCRSGYVCRSLRLSPDAGILPIGFCWPSCVVTGCATGACQPSGYCQ